MKRMALCGVILGLIFALSFWNAWYLRSIIVPMSDDLTGAVTLAQGGDWDGAAEQVDRTREDWLSHETYLYITLRHTDTDNILLSFQETDEFLKARDLPEFSARCADLAAQLNLLYGMEDLSIQNVL